MKGLSSSQRRRLIMDIMFDDLIVEAQERLLEEAGVRFPEEMHWDTIPLAVVEFRDDSMAIDEDDIAENLYDYDYDEDEP